MKKELLFDYPLDDLKGLYHDVQYYKQELVKDSENPIRVKLMGKAELKKKTDELDELLTEIEAFANEEGIDLRTDEVKVKEVQINKQELLTKIEATQSKQTGDLTANGDNYVLVNDPNQQLLLLKRIDIINSKLDQLDNIIGLKEYFADESVFAKFQNNINEIDLLDPETIAHTIKKLEMVTGELKRLVKDRKMNYFNQTQKEELKDFLSNFTDIASNTLENMAKEYEHADNRHNVLKYSELLENNSEMLERLGKAVSQVTMYKNMLDRYLKDANENHAVLGALKTKIAENKATLDSNLQLLKKA